MPGGTSYRDTATTVLELVPVLLSPPMHQRLKSLIQTGEPAFGVWCALDAPPVLEAIGALGPDWVLIDCEHGMASADLCLPQLVALGGCEASAIVRLPKADPSLAARVLDAGADGILVPRVDDAETAARMLDACLYPPRGRRGIGPHRASRYFADTPHYLKAANNEVVVMVQVESREAVECIDEILAVGRDGNQDATERGLDAVFIGPADLSASLGHFGNPKAAEVQEAVAHVLARAQQAGVAAGYYCQSAREARERVEQGFQVVNVSHDLGALVSGVGRALAQARNDD
jgi:2-dehydro-3-deoxyglucarate aldolase